MKAARVIAIAALIATTSGLALHGAQAQLVGARRIDLQRHDLTASGREVIQTIVELEPGTTAPRHSHPGEEIQRMVVLSRPCRFDSHSFAVPRGE